MSERFLKPTIYDRMCISNALKLTLRHYMCHTRISTLFNVAVFSSKTWPHPRGMKYWASSKILLGGLLVFLLIVVIWFPLLFMSFINSAYISNIPVDATFTLSVGGYQVFK